MASPRFSIVVPTCDRESALDGCLDALGSLEAPTRSFEVIVVDDGGSGPLDELIAPYSRSLDLTLHRQPNRGPGAARNAGAQLARGELLAFIDDDVRVSAGWLGAMDQAARAAPSAAFGGRIAPPDGAGRSAAVSELIVDLATERRERPAAPSFLPSSNLVVPAADFHLVGGFDRALRVSEDRELCRRWLASGRSLAYVAGAACTHAKRLTVAGFAKQHFRYGQGAFAFQRGRPDPGSLIEVIEPRFYRRVLRVCGSALGRGDLAQIGLIALWQLANAAGFASAALGSLLGRRPAAARERAA
jgi:GT2 family glycosyltransferase